MGLLDDLIPWLGLFLFSRLELKLLSSYFLILSPTGVIHWALGLSIIFVFIMGLGFLSVLAVFLLPSSFAFRDVH